MGEWLSGIPGEAITGVLLLLGTISAGVIAARAKRPETTSSLIDDLQVRQTKTDERADRLERRLGEAEGLQRRTLDYVAELRAHIDAGKPPPPPAWPPELTGPRGGDT